MDNRNSKDSQSLTTSAVAPPRPATHALDRRLRLGLGVGEIVNAEAWWPPWKSARTIPTVRRACRFIALPSEAS